MSIKTKWIIIIGCILVILVSTIIVCTTVFRAKDTEPQSIETQSPQTSFEEEHTVMFMAEGTVLKTDIVCDGQDAVAPSSVPAKEGWVFNGWDVSFRGIHSDTVVSAVYTKIDLGKNTITLSGGKGKNGETLDLYLELCGEVCLCGLDLIISFDKTALEIVEITDADGFVIANFDNSLGEIYLNYRCCIHTAEDCPV